MHTVHCVKYVLCNLYDVLERGSSFLFGRFSLCWLTSACQPSTQEVTGSIQAITSNIKEYRNSKTTTTTITTTTSHLKTRAEPASETSSVSNVLQTVNIDVMNQPCPKSFRESLANTMEQSHIWYLQLLPFVITVMMNYDMYKHFPLHWVYEAARSAMLVAELSSWGRRCGVGVRWVA